MPFFGPYFYYIIIGLQLICVIHCIRKGNQNNWIWLIVFLPLIGCIIYLFTEVFTRRGIQQVQSGMADTLIPTRKIKKLEEKLRFSDTFSNRVDLADAYMNSGQIDKATELYESSLTNNFTENEDVLMKLIPAYFAKKQYEKIIPIGKKVNSLPEFARSRSYILYAMSLSHIGQKEEAEKEFSKMKAKFSNYEARFQYGMFLINTQRVNKGLQLFSDIANEAKHLSPRERRYNLEWIEKAKAELKKY